MAIMSVYAPDGRPRRHAWDPTIAKERSQVLKMVATVTALATIVSVRESCRVPRSLC